MNIISTIASISIATGIAKEALCKWEIRDGFPVLPGTAKGWKRWQRCISPGAQTPTEEICHAIHDYGADIAGLSFSASFSKRKIAPVLKELRALAPGEIELWAGGTGAMALDRTSRGVTVLSSLHGVVNALQKFRKRYASAN